MSDNKLEVFGVAVRPGISKNGIMYTEEELNKFSGTLKNKPILKDHESKVDNIIGVVEITNSNQGVVEYKGWVKEDGTGIIEKIKDGRIKEVSIGAFCKQLVKENDDDDFVTAVGMEGMELSVTPTPGVKGTSLQQCLMSENHKLPIIENFNLNKKEENKMSEEVKTEKVETPVTEEVKKEEIKTESQPVKIDVDTSKLDEALKKYKELIELKDKLNVKEEKKMDTMKGKIAKEEAKEEVTKQDYVIESSEIGTGFVLYKVPKADGTY